MSEELKQYGYWTYDLCQLCELAGFTYQWEPDTIDDPDPASTKRAGEYIHHQHHLTLLQDGEVQQQFHGTEAQCLIAAIAYILEYRKCNCILNYHWRVRGKG